MRSLRFETRINYRLSTLSIERQEIINILNDEKNPIGVLKRSLKVKRLKRINRILNYYYIKRKGL